MRNSTPLTRARGGEALDGRGDCFIVAGSRERRSAHGTVAVSRNPPHPDVRGGANYVYEVGPDHRQYAVGGDVTIDISPEREPRDTINKMQIVQRAALAPADPSPQDRAVAAEAAAVSMQAQAEFARRRQPDQAQPDGAVAGATGSLLDLLL